MSGESDCSTPHAARVWDYWLGGRDNFESDRTAAESVARAYPEIVVMARQTRRFLIRTVGFLAAEAEVGQFVDVGAGLPTMQATHEVAQSIRPDARVVYVDNDPVVRDHARTLLAERAAEGVAYRDGDLRDPQRLLATAAEELDLTRPVAVIFMGVLGYVAELAELREIVTGVLAGVPAGSYLVLCDGTDTGVDVRAGSGVLTRAGVPYHLRTPEEIAAGLAGLDLMEPGLVPITTWRPGAAGGTYIDVYGAVARKP